MVLIFDSYGTLVEMDDFYGRLQRGLGALGHQFPLEAVKSAAHQEMRHYMSRARFAVDQSSYLEIRDECADVFAGGLREQNLQVSACKTTLGELISDSAVYRALPSAAETLAALKNRGASLGVLSNWDFNLPHVLEEAGLARFFDWILPSASAGHEKPAREFFEKGLLLARKKFPNLRPRDCFYIGDHYEKDVLGARNAGFSPLWLVRNQRDLPSGEIHEAKDDNVPVLRSLKDLLEMF